MMNPILVFGNGGLYFQPADNVAGALRKQRFAFFRVRKISGDPAPSNGEAAPEPTLETWAPWAGE